MNLTLEVSGYMVDHFYPVFQKPGEIGRLYKRFQVLEKQKRNNTEDKQGDDDHFVRFKRIHMRISILFTELNVFNAYILAKGLT